MGIDLKDKIILITNSHTNLGIECAKQLSYNGATLILHYFKTEEKDAVGMLETVKEENKNSIVYKCDLTNRKEVNTMVDLIVDKFGKLDVLVNNNSISFSIKPFLDLDYLDIDKKITGEVKSLHYCSKAVLRNMIKRKSGKIVILNSNLSRYEGYGFTAHAAAKSAIDAIAKVMSVELAPFGVNVNVVSPALEDSGKIIDSLKHKKDIIDKEVGITVSFLSSDFSNSINGAVFVV